MAGMGSIWSSTLSVSMRAMSSTSLMSESRWSPALAICSTYSVLGSSSSSSSRSWAKPSMALSGVRSSWLTRERNSLLALLARSACSLARRSACSRAIWSVMSRLTITMPSWVPSGAVITWAWDSMVTHTPSAVFPRNRRVTRLARPSWSWARRSAVSARSSGWTTSTRRWSTSTRVGYPKIRSKAMLVVRMVPSSSRIVMTSGEAPMTVDSTRSRAATLATASFTSVMSVEIEPTATGTPSGSSSGNFTDRKVWGPSSSSMTSSNCIGSRVTRICWSRARSIGAASGQWSKSSVPTMRPPAAPNNSASARLANW